MFLLLRITPNYQKFPDLVDLVKMPLKGLWQVPGSVCHQYFLLNCFSVKEMAVSRHPRPFVNQRTKNQVKIGHILAKLKVLQRELSKNGHIVRNFVVENYHSIKHFQTEQPKYTWARLSFLVVDNSFFFRIWYHSPSLTYHRVFSNRNQIFFRGKFFIFLP